VGGRLREGEWGKECSAARWPQKKCTDRAVLKGEARLRLMPYPTINLEGRVALVTGGTRGLGYSLALGLANAGADVVLTSRDSGAAAQAATAIAAATGRRVLGVRADVRLPSEAAAMVQHAVSHFGRLHILVNNAGVAYTRLAEDVTEEEWDDVLDTHLKGTFFASQAAFRHMRSAGGGVVVNISSVVGAVGEPWVAPYCAAKAGINNLTRVLALEWVRYNVRVVGVAPGYLRTSLNEAWFKDERALRHVISKTPMRRLATPEEVSNAVNFLASDLATYITGETLYVDGGWTAQ